MLVEYFNQNLKFYFPVHSEAAVGVDCCSSAQSLKTFIGGPTDEWRMRDLTSRIGKMFSGASRTFRSSNPSFISLMIRFFVVTIQVVNGNALRPSKLLTY